MVLTYNPPNKNRFCHFHGGVAKFTFLLFPILLLLIANSVMFCSIAHTLYKNMN